MSNDKFANNQPKPGKIIEQTAPVVPMGGSGNEHKNERGPFELSENQKTNGKNRLVQNAEQTASHTNKLVQGRTQTQKPTTPSPTRG